MPQANITVAGINPPALGKKQGHIIDSAGGKWNVWGDKLQNYRMGVTYNINYDEKEFNGTKFFVITNADPSGQPAQQGPQQSTRPSSPAAASQSIVTEKDRQIFVCALMGRALMNPNTDPFNLDRAKIAEYGTLFSDLFTYLFGPKPSKGEMNDEIPF